MKKGEEYFNKRDGVKGTIKAFDDFTVTMDLENEITKIYTRSMFRKWWVALETKPKSEVKKDIKNSGAIKQIDDEFVKLLSQYGDENLEKFYRGSHCIVKYKGRIILDVIMTKFKYTIFAHIEALSPQLSGLYEVIPQEHHKNLRAKFVFTSYAEAHTMLKIIVTDSIFYRK